VTPVIQPVIEPQKYSGTVSASSRFFPYYRWQKIPDGVHKWTTFKIPVSGFEDDSKLTKARISLDIRTAHRGDLQVVLEGPGGLQALIHNEQGGTKNNLVIKDMDVSSFFTDTDLSDTWYLRVQDRLKGDTATLKSIVLEISAAAPEITPEP
jgi:subtilisin-like proprotein convertase family protein